MHASRSPTSSVISSILTTASAAMVSRVREPSLYCPRFRLGDGDADPAAHLRLRHVPPGARDDHPDYPGRPVGLHPPALRARHRGAGVYRLRPVTAARLREGVACLVPARPAGPGALDP